MSQFGTSDWAQLHRQVLTGQGPGTEKALDWGYIGVINRDYVRVLLGGYSNGARVSGPHWQVGFLYKLCVHFSALMRAVTLR